MDHFAEFDRTPMTWEEFQAELAKRPTQPVEPIYTPG